MNKNTQAHIGLLFTNIFFTANLSTVKYLTRNGMIQPFGLNVIRVVVSVALFWLFHFIYGKSEKKLRRSDIPRFVLCGLTGIAINQLLFLKGLSLTHSIHAALLMLTTPILITISAAWILRERINFYKVAGLALGIGGAITLVTAKSKSDDGSNVLLGDLLVITNAISYTVYFIIVKPLMKRYSPMEIIRWAFTFGMLFVLPFGWNEFTDIQWTSIPMKGYVFLGLIVFGGTFLAYLFNVNGIRVLGASVAGTYIYLQPVFAAIIAKIFLNEPITVTTLLAAAMIFSGVYLSNRSTIIVEEEESRQDFLG